MFSNLKEFAVVSALVYLHMAWFPTNQFTLVLPLLYIYYNCGCDKYSKDIKIGLALAVIGDLFIPYQHTALKLVIQMALFLRAIFFVKGFWQGCSFGQVPNVAITAGALMYVHMMLKFVPGMPDMFTVFALAGYGAVSVSLVVLAFARAQCHNGIDNTSKLFALIGAIVFFISDLILANEKFVKPMKNFHFRVLMAYYIGITFIGASAWPGANTDTRAISRRNTRIGH